MQGLSFEGIVRFQVSGVRKDAEKMKNYLDKECIRMLNGLEKTLERKVPARERRWHIAEEPALFSVNYEKHPQGWPIPSKTES
jgi:hypothetical protein